VLSGRAPAGPDELVLGARTLAKLHKRVGDTVKEDVGPPVGTLTLRIVGAMITPSVGDIFTNGPGDGARIDGSAFKSIQAQMPADPGGSGPPQTTFRLFAVRFAPGVPPTAGYASLRRQFGPVVLRRLPPEDVINLHSVQDLPLILAALVGLLGLATIGHTLVTSVRGRRHDLAVLKTMGFRWGQVAATVLVDAGRGGRRPPGRDCSGAVGLARGRFGHQFHLAGRRAGPGPAPHPPRRAAGCQPDGGRTGVDGGPGGPGRDPQGGLKLSFVSYSGRMPRSASAVRAAQ
jgi:hypothetical protein